MKGRTSVSLEEAVSRLLSSCSDLPPYKVQACKDLAEEIVSFSALAGSYATDSVIQFYSERFKVPAFEKPESLPAGAMWKAGYVINIYRIMTGKDCSRHAVYFNANETKWYEGILDDYLAWLRDCGKSTGTIRTRQETLPYFLDFLGVRNINQVPSLRIEDYESFLTFIGEQPYTQWTKSTIISSVKDFTRYLQEKELISCNPLIMLSGIKAPRRKNLPKFYTPEEVRKLIATIDRTTNRGKTTYAMLLLVAVYGMRGVDVTLLTLDDIRWEEERVVFTQQKTGKTIEFPLIKEVRLAILDYISNVRHNCGHRNVFIREAPPYVPYRPGAASVGRFLSNLFIKAGIDTKGRPIGPHALRYSLATLLSGMDTPINEIAHILGHSSVQSSLTYVWSDIEHLRIAAQEVLPYAE